MKELFKDYKKITLSELNKNTRDFILDFLKQATNYGFLYFYEGHFYKITYIERKNDNKLEIEFYLVEDDDKIDFEFPENERFIHTKKTI